MISDPVIVVAAITRALERLGVRHLVGGSLASSVYGTPRATQNADLVADLAPGQVSSFVAALSDEFYADIEMIDAAVRRRSSFNVLYLPTMFKIDVFVMREDAWWQEEMKTIVVAQRPQAGGSIATIVDFTCTNSPNGATTFITVAGQCVNSCTKPNGSSVPSFSKSSGAPVPCSGGRGSTTILSPPNLDSGTWQVTVTPNVPYMNLTAAEAFTCSNIGLKAGEHPTVTVKYDRTPQLTWDMTCHTSP